MKKNAPAGNIDEYLAAVPKPARTALEDLRKMIRAAAPNAVEVISYQIPTFKHNGMLVSFAAFQNHCSFFVGRLVSKYKKDLKGYDASGGTIRFQSDEPLPRALVTKLVKARLAENQKRMEKRNRKR